MAPPMLPEQEQSVEILLEMARNGEIDPWNIDITDITDKFLKKLTEMEKLDLRVSARTLLYASILLRMKSDILVNAPPPEEPEYEEPDFDLEPDDYPVLEPKLRHVASRPVTLQELLDELKRAVSNKDIPALRKQQRAHDKPRRKTLEEVLGIAHEEDIEKSIMELIKVLDAEFAYREFVLLSELIKDNTPKGIIDVYLPLLFIANRKYIALTQEVLFDEIFIRRGTKLG